MNSLRPTSLKQTRLDRSHRQPIVFLFNGQGSQYYHMARTLYQRHEAFRNTLMHLDRHIQRHIGVSMLSVVYDSERDKGMPFTDVRFTHPAIFCIQYALADLLRRAGWLPDYVLGMSLGEFVAAAISGAMEPEIALDAVLEQALAIERSCPPGGMTAIISSVVFFTEHPEIFSESELAGVNYDEHFVIAGAIDVLERIQATLKNYSVPYLSLPVKYGFHSRLIDPASPSYLDYLEKLPVGMPLIPVISCQTGTEIPYYSKDHLWRVAREPTRFPEVLQWLENQVGEGGGNIYIDLGPGGTLANFIKRSLDIHSASSYQSVITPFDQEVARLQAVEQSLQINVTRG